MAVTISVVLMAAMLAATWFAAQYMVSLPYAPECPACKRVTAQCTRTSRADRLFAQLSGADARQCTRCGWAGRMRWRLAEERVKKR
ncbi:MAG TPA: hypothetical protein VGC13_08045 [Longimicrobium sp.]|uniref:hypothetical protein n=1 Tax=Longimicrobium sp. TaxID=2029185 RepID=UPI002EDA7FA4